MDEEVEIETDDTHRIDSDEPIASSDQDIFARKQFSHRIANLLITRNDPSSVTIGISAPWGEGKSSVLNMVEEHLKAHDIQILNFNPWRFSDEDTLLKTFYFDLAKLIGVDLEKRLEKFGGIVTKYAIFGSLIPGIKLDKGLEGIALFFPSAAIEELKKRIEVHLNAKKRLVVVLIDDIDRLDVNEIRSVFRLIKLSASFSHTAYIVAFDEKRVAEALTVQYGDNDESGRKYLDKILQLSLSLPPASPQILMRMTVEGINHALSVAGIETDENQNKRFSEYFSKAFRPRLTSPRVVKRFTNELMFSMPLLKGEVNPTDLIFVEAIKVFYPELYRAIRINGEHILDFTVGDSLLGRTEDTLAGDLVEVLTLALSDVRAVHQTGIDLLVLDLFPGLSRLGRFPNPSVTYPDADPIKARRISTREYFWRYFSYGIQPGDVSDNEIERLLDEIDLEGWRLAKERLSAYLSEEPSRIELVIGKLRSREDGLNPYTASNLAVGLSGLSKQFPLSHPDDHAIGIGVRREIARLLLHLATSLDSAERFALLLELAETTPDLLFAFDLAQMVSAFGERTPVSEEGAWLIASHGVEREVNKIVANRIAEQADRMPPEELNFGWAQELYIFWFNNAANSLAEYYQRLLDGDVSIFLRAVGGLARYDTTGTKTFTSGLHRSINWIGMLSKLVDIDRAVALIDAKFLGVQGETGGQDRERIMAKAFLDEYERAETTR